MKPIGEALAGALAELEKKRRPGNAPPSHGAPAKPTADPACPQCLGMAWVANRSDPVVTRYEPCPCKQTERVARRQREMAKWSSLEDYRGCTFARLTERPGQEAAFHRARAFAQEPRGWLVLLGPPGTGKTALGAAIGWEIFHAGEEVLFISAPELMEHLKRAFNPNVGSSYDERFERIENTSVLILDDLGAESRTEWVSEQMHILLDLRSRQGRPTMITSNVPLGQMGQRDASRIADLPAGHVLVYVGGHDQRTGTPAGDGLVYHQLGGRPLICAMCHSRPCLPTCKKHMFGPPPEEA